MLANMEACLFYLFTCLNSNNIMDRIFSFELNQVCAQRVITNFMFFTSSREDRKQNLVVCCITATRRYVCLPNLKKKKLLIS